MNEDIIKLLAHKNHDEIKGLLGFFLTASERQALTDRLLLIKLLLDNELTQREISTQYAISIAKITRGSNMLKTLNKSQLMRLRQWLGLS